MLTDNLLKRLLTGAKDAILMRSAGLVLLFLMHMLLGRCLGPEAYGTFNYAFTLAAVGATFAPMGWHTAIIRYIAEYMEKGEWGLMRGALSSAQRSALLAAVPGITVLLSASYFTSRESLAVSCGYAAFLLPLLAFIYIRRGALQGLKKVKSSIVPEEVVIPGVFIASVLLFSISTARGALAAFIASTFAALAVSSVLLKRAIPPETKTSEPEFRGREWMLVAMPMVVAGINQLLMNRADVVLLGLLTDMKSVGLYSAASRVASLNVFAMTAINVVGAPLLASAYYGGRGADFRRIMRDTTYMCVIGALPAFLIMFFWPSVLLGFFGGGFESGSSLLRILAAGQFVNASTGLVGTALVMTGREKTFALVTGASALFNIAGNIAAIPLLGATGAAVATATTTVLFNGTLFYIVRGIKTEGIQPEAKIN